jgi:2,3-dimethylmalate lyase
MGRTTLRGLLEGRAEPLLLPCAHDALAARLIEQAGFEAFSIGGFGVILSRLGLPDIGLASFGEISAAVRDIAASVQIPVLVDADDGYGDVKNVTRTVQVYEAMRVGGIVLEDQTSPKRCGHMAGKSVVSVEAAAQKIEAAVAARRDPDLLIAARTDARAVHGLDDALRRAERYKRAGADILFVEAPQDEDELRTIGRSLPGPLLVNMAEGGRTPILPPRVLGEMGFALAVYPSTLFLRCIGAMQGALSDLRAGTLALPTDAPSFADILRIGGMPAWDAVDDRYPRLRTERA